MMTPEQLVTAWTNCRDTRKAREILLQFQLDAYKAGMTKATELSLNWKRDYSVLTTQEDIAQDHAAVSISNEIILHRDNLKEIPNE